MLSSSRKILLTLWACCAFAVGCVHSHDKTIYGQVRDTQGQPVSGVIISVDPNTAFSSIYAATSDAQGMYSIEEGQFDLFFINELLDPTHEIIFKAAHPSYQPFQADVSFKVDTYRYDIVMRAK